MGSGTRSSYETLQMLVNEPLGRSLGSKDLDGEGQDRYDTRT